MPVLKLSLTYRVNDPIFTIVLFLLQRRNKARRHINVCVEHQYTLSHRHRVVELTFFRHGHLQ